MNSRMLMRGIVALVWSCAVWMPGLAQAGDAGRVIAVSGEATVLRGGQRLPIQKGIVLLSGDTVVTGEGGRVRWQMSDESYFSLKPQSNFRIDDYVMPDQGAAGAKAFYRLQDGGVATLSGLIKSPESYRLQTPAASIAVQGTRYKSAFCKNGNCKTRKGEQDPDGVYLGVDEGVVVMANPAGRLAVNAGQYAYAADNKTAPRLLKKAPAIFVEASADFDLDVEARAELGPGNTIERPVLPNPRVITEPPASPF